MHIMKTHLFAKWAKNIGITDTLLCAAASEVAAGFTDINFNRSMCAKHIVGPRTIERVKTRTVIICRNEIRMIFFYGFSKKETAAMSVPAFILLRALADELLSYDNTEIIQALEDNELIKVRYNG